MSNTTIISTVGWVAFAIGCVALLIQETTPSDAALVVCAAGLSAWACCSAIAGILSGTIDGKYFSYSQADNPNGFWLTVAVYAVMGVGLAYAAVRGATIGFGP